MIPFLSCDWGTSSFRLSLVDAENYQVLESEHTNEGILTTYNNWIETTHSGDAERLAFYLAVIRRYMLSIEVKAGRPLDGIPLLISGMASSSIGMIPLPYRKLPFRVDGSDLLTEFLRPTPEFKHDILLISGARTDDDVMRGEETQLIGMLQEMPVTPGDRLLIFPGTHSKHIMVNGNHATTFKTYMTGEFFDLLSKKSILHTGLEDGDGLNEGSATATFKKAVEEGSRSTLLNSCFKVRTNALFDTYSKKENYYYLSGLLIGAELGEIVHNDTIEIYLCCGAQLKPYYETALEALGLTKKVRSFAASLVDKAAIAGQYQVYTKHNKR